jgi:hypothetical protein
MNLRRVTNVDLAWLKDWNCDLLVDLYNILSRWKNYFSQIPSRGTMLQAGRSRERVPMRWIFFNLPNPSSRNMALGSAQPLTEMSTRNLPEG